MRGALLSTPARGGVEIPDPEYDADGRIVYDVSIIHEVHGVVVSRTRERRYGDQVGLYAVGPGGGYGVERGNFTVFCWVVGTLMAVATSYAVAMQIADELSRVFGDEVPPQHYDTKDTRILWACDTLHNRVVSCCVRYRKWLAERTS